MATREPRLRGERAFPALQRWESIENRSEPRRGGRSCSAVPTALRPQQNAHPALNHPKSHKSGASWGPRSRWAKLFRASGALSTQFIVPAQSVGALRMKAVVEAKCTSAEFLRL